MFLVCIQFLLFLLCCMYCEHLLYTFVFFASSFPPMSSPHGSRALQAVIWLYSLKLCSLNLPSLNRTSLKVEMCCKLHKPLFYSTLFLLFSLSLLSFPVAPLKLSAVSRSSFSHIFFESDKGNCGRKKLEVWEIHTRYFWARYMQMRGNGEGNCVFIWCFKKAGNPTVDDCWIPKLSWYWMRGIWYACCMLPTSDGHLKILA